MRQIYDEKPRASWQSRQILPAIYLLLTCTRQRVNVSTCVPTFFTGSAVYYDDEVVFESVKHEGLRLHCSHGKEMEYHSVWPREGDGRGIRGPASLVPQTLRSLDTTEVNGGPDRSSFVLCRYATYIPGPPSLRTGGMFRIFHPVAEGMICASCDSDKRKFLKSARRGDGSPAHLPYLKKLDYPDPMHPSNSSAKGVWSTEEVNRATGADVFWESPCTSGLRALESLVQWIPPLGN